MFILTRHNEASEEVMETVTTNILTDYVPGDCRQINAVNVLLEKRLNRL